jgi:hypothetical protein
MPSCAGGGTEGLGLYCVYMGAKVVARAAMRFAVQ